MIYFDNAATSWPKPPAVRVALDEYFGEAGGNPGRSGHRMSIAAARIVENAREAVAELLNAQDPSRIIKHRKGCCLRKRNFMTSQEKCDIHFSTGLGPQPSRPHATVNQIIAVQ